MACKLAGESRASFSRFKELRGHRPFQDEADPRPLPEAAAIGGAVADQYTDRFRVATVSTIDVLIHASKRRILRDVVTRIREGCTLDDAGFRHERDADRYLKWPEETARLFAGWPEVVARSVEIAERCGFSLDELQ